MPREVSARRPPPNHGSLLDLGPSGATSSSSSKPTPRDPRFSTLNAAVNKSASVALRQHYSFLSTMRGDEDATRLRRLGNLRREIRRREAEVRGDDDGGADSEGRNDASECDTVLDGCETTTTPVHLLSDRQLVREQATLQQHHVRHQQIIGEHAAKDRKRRAAATLVKREVNDVVAGKKSRPHFPKRQEVKLAAQGARFAEAKDGPEAAALRYTAKREGKKTSMLMGRERRRPNGQR